MLHQDVLSYQRVIDSVDDKARTLVQSSSDPQLANFVSQTGSRYEKLCSHAKVSNALNTYTHAHREKNVDEGYLSHFF